MSCATLVDFPSSHLIIAGVMRARRWRRWIAARVALPWVLVVVVALVVGAPVLVLGRASDDATRDRLHAEQLGGATHIAELIVRAEADRAMLIRDTIGAF